jgi:phage gp36-like protein
MSYAVKQDMIDRFGEAELIKLTDRDYPATPVINDTVLNAALADAEAEINSYLSGRYILPLTHTPAVLVRIACDIARHRLWVIDPAPEQVAKRFRDAIAFLTSVAEGTSGIGVDTALEKPTIAAGKILVDAPDQIFTTELLKGYTGWDT